MGVTQVRRISGASALLTVALVAVLLFALSGCKYSDVLTQHIEDPDLGILDESADPVYIQNENGEYDPDRVDTPVDNDDNVNDQEHALPHYDPSAPDNGPTKRLVNSTETPHDEEAAEGQEEQEDEPDRGGQGGGGETGGAQKSPDEGEGEGDNKGSGEDLDSDETDEQGSDPSSAGTGGTTVISDDDGTNDNTAKGTVAAVGEYATITQMLAGAGGLVACDQAWLDGIPAGAFKGELDAVTVAWSGDGTESGSCDVDLLINTVKPSVMLWDGVAPAISDEERERLEGAGIEIQPVPRIGQANTEDVDITGAVTEVAAVLNGASGVQYDPIAMRDSYISLHDGALKACYESNGSAFSYKAVDSSNPKLYQATPLTGLGNSTTTRTLVAYIDNLWHPSVTSAIVSQVATVATGYIELGHNGDALDVSDGVALSASSSTDSYLVLDYYLQFSGLVNNAYDTAKPDPTGRRYILMAGSTASFGTSGSFAARTGNDSALWCASGDSTVASNWKALGSAEFPAVIVNGEADEDIADAIVESSKRRNGLYNMDESYRVYVMPSGISGNWAYGNVESFLASLWAWRVYGDENLSAAAPTVESFYKTFYRCDDWSQVVKNWDSAYTAQ